MILYLDYDGVLHSEYVYRTTKGIAIKGPGTLFEHVAVLESALEPHPDVEIVLSTSWVREVGFLKAKKRLSPALQARVIGATYHSVFESYDNQVRDIYTRSDSHSHWQTLSRYAQIDLHVSRHNITDWLAIDDDGHGWPEALAHRLILTDDIMGLGEKAAEIKLRTVLASLLRSTEG